MRRLLLALSCGVVVSAVACGAADQPQLQVAPTAPPPVAPTPPAAHPPAPPVPPGVELSSLDAAISPCDDFFGYACGGWNKANPIPEDQGRWGRFNQLAEQNELALRAILEQDAKPGATGPYAKALGDFYSSCMDEAAVEKDGTKALAPRLAEIARIADAKSLARVTANILLAGGHPFIEVGAEQDAKDATQMIAGVDQAGLGMPDRDYYLKDDEKTVHVRDAYSTHVEKVFQLLGDTESQAKEEAASVLKLEKVLAQAQISRVEHRDPAKVYHKVDRAGLAHAAPAFDWDAFWKELGRPEVTAINLAVPSYVTAAFAPLAGGQPAAWLGPYKSYLRWHYVMPYQRVLTQKFLDESFAFDKELTGAAKIEPRWKRCVRAVDRGLGEALAIPFVQQKLGDEGKATTQAIVKEIEAAMEEDLESLSWMDAATREKAEIKVRKLFNKIGYPDSWRNYDALAAKVQRRSYASNFYEAGRFDALRDLAEIGKPVDRAEWHMTPPTVNAYYNPPLNEMVFPAGILQPPFYANGAPVAVNFGGLGMVAGRELTHGFDDEGRQYDADGNLKDWWTPAVSQAFDQRAACVADQFDGYVAVDDLHVNGKLTLGENLADLGGAKLALAVLHEREPVSVEADRQFFFGVSQIWCGSMRPEMARVRVRTDPHSPAKYRVNGPLSNMPEFAKAFSCQPGDTMVRPEEKRCAVW